MVHPSEGRPTGRIRAWMAGSIINLPQSPCEEHSRSPPCKGCPTSGAGASAGLASHRSSKETNFSLRIWVQRASNFLVPLRTGMPVVAEAVRRALRPLPSRYGNLSSPEFRSHRATTGWYFSGRTISDDKAFERILSFRSVPDRESGVPVAARAGGRRVGAGPVDLGRPGRRVPREGAGPRCRVELPPSWGD